MLLSLSLLLSVSENECCVESRTNRHLNAHLSISKSSMNVMVKQYTYSTNRSECVCIVGVTFDRVTLVQPHCSRVQGPVRESSQSLVQATVKGLKVTDNTGAEPSIT